MAVRLTVIGSYPRPPREGGEFRLRKVLQALDRDEAAEADVRAAEDELVGEIVAEQVAAGVDLVTDGQVRWADPPTRLASGLEGFEVSGLLRWFDNNTYFRQPVVSGDVRWAGPITVDEIRFAVKAAGGVPVKATLLGPYTLAALSKHDGDVRALVARLAAALNQEARALVEAGAEVVQFDEPALARVPGQPPGDLDVLASVAGALVDGVRATTVLCTYFGDVAAHGPAFFELPFGGFGLDLVAGPANVELLHDFPSDRVLQAGIADARNTKLESADELAFAVEDLLESVAAERLWIAPSCGLEFLPREAAERKLRRLAEVKERFS